MNGPMDAIKIIVADNQYLTKAGLLSLLKGILFPSEILEVSNKDELNDVLKVKHPRLLIIDPDLFDFNSIEELIGIRQSSPDTSIIIFTNNSEARQVEKLIELGITVYVLKTAQKTEIDNAIEAALNDKHYFSNDILEQIISKKIKQKTTGSSSHLTHSETEIIKLIAQGLTTKDIAAQKFISFHTVITHRKNIFRKLGINNTSELVAFAFRSGIIDNTEYYI